MYIVFSIELGVSSFFELRVKGVGPIKPLNQRFWAHVWEPSETGAMYLYV